MKNLLRLKAKAKPHRHWFLFGTLCAVLAAPFSAIAVNLVAVAGGILNNAGTLAASGLLEESLLMLALALPALALFKGLMSYGAMYSIARYAEEVLRDLRADLYRSQVERPLQRARTGSTGETVSRITNDVQRIQTGLAQHVSALMVNFPTAIILAGFLVWRSWRLALVALILIPIAGGLVQTWSRKLKAASRLAQEQTANLASVLSETIDGLRVVRAYRAEEREKSRFAGFNEWLRRAQMRAHRTIAMSSPIMELLGSVLMAILIAVAAYQIKDGTLTAELAVAFVTGMTMLYKSVKSCTRALNELQNTEAASGRCFEMLDEAADAQAAEPSGTKVVEGLSGGIVFDRVSLELGGNTILDDVSFQVRKGEVVALVGESGAGKTTLTDLLVRFQDATGGAVTWDGSELRDVTPGSLRENIALVQQESVIFNDTVLANIAYGDPEPDAARAEEAAKAAHAHVFVSRLSDGYDTVLGERGGRLSGGERQRLAIARAIYKDAPVLILDEATSALDSQSETLVKEALARLLTDRTALVVAHRLATVRTADRIIVLEAGRLVQQGTHDELVAQDGLYRRLHELQAGSS
ncbi:MAG: ABC transporter ATP-binding protein [Acidobacteriota bacterium]